MIFSDVAYFPADRKQRTNNYLAKMVVTGETNEFMYFEAGRYALLNRL